ncbi:MAG: chemotaxis protein CheA, partial [Planctomycetota bacterium]|nr:chemotaxis protein CheA [Planctomycetota bacterium]
MSAFEPEILQDFLTESGELLDALEGDLVALEQTPGDSPLINKVFRALHTIKGSASFLALTNLVAIAHSAESALNAARNGQAVVDRAMMDLLLQAVDLLKRQMDELRNGQDLTAPQPALIAGLNAIAEGKAAAKPTGAPTTAATATIEPPTASVNTGLGTGRGSDGGTGGGEFQATPLELGPGQVDLFDFLIADLDESLKKVESLLGAVADPSTRAGSTSGLSEQAESLAKSVEFFGAGEMARLSRLLGVAAESLSDLPAQLADQALARMRAVSWVLSKQAEGLREKQLRAYATGALAEHLESIASGQEPPSELKVDPAQPVERVLALEGVIAPAPVAADVAASTPAPRADDHAEPAAKSAEKGPEKSAEGGEGKAANVEQTIRVEVNRLETLMNLVGELVLQKNRIAAVSRQLGARLAGTPYHDLSENMSLAAGNLDRVAADIQLAVMRTRMQPLDKLFGKYPRLIRDLSRKTGKQIELVIEGGETEVDKSVIEELGDPLVHLMRNSADHGLEPPEERVATGKGPVGTITLSAANEGGSVKVLVKDDGRGLRREKIARKAIERGLVSESDVANLSDKDVFNFIFLPGFSTADQVSDLSGRGVGMDVVRTNIEKLKGTIELASTPGAGTTITITIPLTLAILPAMLVGVADEVYAIPLDAILEIVRPTAEQLTSIGEHPVMRLRETVLPLIKGSDALALPPEKQNADQPFAVILTQNDKRVGLLVSR